MTIAVQSLGLVMVLKTVKIKLMAVILPAMMMTAVTALILSVVMAPVMVLKPKQIVQKTAHQVRVALTVNLIGQLTALNVVTQHGMSMV